MTVPRGTDAGYGPDAPRGGVVVTRNSGGGLRVTHPQAVGFVAVALTPVQLAQAVERAMREADVAAYAARKGERYDLALHDQAAAELAAEGKQLPHDEAARAAVVGTLACAQPQTESTAAADPLRWTPLADGRMLSPSGRRYRADSQVVRRVRAQREAMGVDVPA